MGTALYVQSSIQSYFYGHWLLETLSDPLLLQWREIAVNKVNIWSHSYSASCTKQLKDIHISVYLLVVKLWLGFGHLIWLLLLRESYVPLIHPLCIGITQAPAFYPNMHYSHFMLLEKTLLMPLRCFMNTAVIPLNDRWSKMEEEEKCVVLAFIFTAARPWFSFTNDPGVNMCHLWEDQLLLIVWTNNSSFFWLWFITFTNC